jgi:hypothetical protein
MRSPALAPIGPIWLALLIWFAAAFVVGALRLLARSPVPPPAIAGGLTLLLCATLLASQAVRERVRAVGLRSLVAFHVIRVAAGAYFLVLSARGELAGEFAFAAGWGDIVVGLGAAAVWWLCFPLRSPAQRRMLLLWNVVGLLDILGVLANGARIFIRDPGVGEPFTRLPLALLPTFVVPLVIVSHVLLFVWARHAQETAR